MRAKNMRVLLVSDMSKVGGTEIATLISAKQLHNQVGYVGVLGKQGPISTEIQSLGIDHFDAEVHTKNPYKLWHYLLSVRNIIDEHQINIIHAQMARPIPIIWLAKLLSGHKNIKIFWTSRGLDHQTYRYVAPLFEKLNVRALGNCKLEQKKLIRNGFKPNHTSYIYNAYRLNPSTAVRPKSKTPPYIIGTLSALRDDRCVDLFIEIAKELNTSPKYNEQVKFLIGGAGPAQARLEQLVKDYHLSEKITFCGNVNDVEAFMQQLHVFVSPIVVEGDSGAGVSNAIIEAMITKTPVCAYDASAISEIVINDSTGYLIEPKNTTAMVQAIINTIEQPNITAKQVENAYNLIIEQCDPVNFTKKLISLYEEL